MRYDAMTNDAKKANGSGALARDVMLGLGLSLVAWLVIFAVLFGGEALQPFRYVRF